MPVPHRSGNSAGVAKERDGQFERDLAKLVGAFVGDDPAVFYTTLMRLERVRTVAKSESLWDRVGEEGEAQSVVSALPERVGTDPDAGDGERGAGGGVPGGGDATTRADACGRPSGGVSGSGPWCGGWRRARERG